MGGNLVVVLYVAALVATIVSVDLLFFRTQFWPRLLVNIGIALLFLGVYLAFLKNP